MNIIETHKLRKEFRIRGKDRKTQTIENCREMGPPSS